MKKPYQNDTKFRENTSIDVRRLDYNEDLLVMWSYNSEVELLRGHFKGVYEEYRHMSKEMVLSRVLQEHLPLHPVIRDKVEKFKFENFKSVIVGVHIRYSDHRASLFAILDKLNELLRIEPELLIFLATDNIRIKKMFEENYSGLITTNHWYPKPGARIHDNRFCPDPLQSGIEALIDLYLLAECNYLIIDTSSSFSYIAKLLTNAQQSNIFDIARGGKLTPGIGLLSWQLMLRLGAYSWGLSILSKIEKTKKLFTR